MCLRFGSCTTSSGENCFNDSSPSMILRTTQKVTCFKCKILDCSTGQVTSEHRKLIYTRNYYYTSERWNGTIPCYGSGLQGSKGCTC